MISPLPAYKIPAYKMPRRFQSGQTLIIALLILGVLLILAGVFAGILNSAIRGAGTASERATVADFSEAGIRFAHSQLLNSELGADWRGTPTNMEGAGVDLTRDPDAFYLRPPATTGTGVALYNPGLNPDRDPTREASARDQGGPDGLGPFFRVNFDRGRALVRVRYAPGDPSVFSSSRVGGLLKPGQARNMIVIESVGRNGLVLANDPTQSRGRGTVRFRNFASQADFETALGRTAEFDAKEQTSRKLVAFAQIGLIDTARYITNKFDTTRPADIGAPSELGTRLADGSPNGTPVRIQTRLGRDATLFARNAGRPGAPITTRDYPAFGSLFSNADLRIHGSVAAEVNPSLGDGWAVAGNVLSGGDDAQLLFRVTEANGAGYNVATRAYSAADLSQLSDTKGGILRDAGSQPDAAGYARGVGRKAPPTILAPAGASEGTVSRYISATRDSGGIGNGGNSGAFGQGSGVYVDNGSDFQASADERGRQIAGTSQGLVQDWLNPFGDGVTFRSGWRGPFYIPVGAYVRLLADGFVIARNANPEQRDEERTWRRPDGSDSGLTTLRYRIGRGTDGELHIVNALTDPAISVDGALSRNDFSRGPLFNGVLYFEGNVRVRGTIPTDVQMTLVTNRTAYIEGSIVKGTVGNDVTSDPSYFNRVAVGDRLARRSRSALMIMAKDYVAVNTTMFNGPGGESNVTYGRGTNGVGGYSPSKVAAPDGSLTLLADLPLAEIGDDPSAWPPLASVHRSYTATNNGELLPTRLMLAHTLETTTSGPQNVFETLSPNPRLFGAATYLFDVLNSRTNSARAQYASLNAPAAPPISAPVYGLGLESWQQSAKFETIGFPIVDAGFAPTGTTYDAVAGRIDANGTNGQYSLLALDTNELKLDLTNLAGEPTGNLLVGRAAVTPGDVRIEASVYAEDGAFFVIPGDWFNPNPNDRRDAWNANLARFQGAGQNAETARISANEQRLTDFGATPDAPFYGEPLDVKVTVVGSVAENMPPPVSQQTEWMRKWGWIPAVNGTRALADGVTPAYAPYDHIASGLDRDFNGTVDPEFSNLASAYAPNLTIEYDPALATGRVAGFSPVTAPAGVAAGDTNPLVRYRFVNGAVQTLPPMPRLPVSPTLAYFGEAK